MKLADRTVVVTGAASGIGRAMVRAFVEEGAHVLALDVDAEGLGKLAAGVRCETAEADVTDEAAITDLLADREVHVLCNNAGVLDRLTPLHETSDDLWHQVMRVNVDGAFFASRAVVHGMVDRGAGVILNTCSAASFHGGRAGAAYTTSKHALLGLTRSIAWFYGPDGIRCNAIAPGAIQTKMHVRQPPNEAGMARYAPYFPTIPPQGRAAQVARAALFLVTDDSDYVNGSCIEVDGGWLAY